VLTGVMTRVLAGLVLDTASRADRPGELVALALL
jgi:hypothetical protein